MLAAEASSSENQSHGTFRSGVELRGSMLQQRGANAGSVQTILSCCAGDIVLQVIFQTIGDVRDLKHALDERREWRITLRGGGGNVTIAARL